MTETAVLSSICDYLALRKHLFWRQNTAGLYRDGRFFSLPKYSMRGLPDIIVIVNGRFLGLEVKQKGTYQSKEQKEFETLCKAHGAEYHVVRSIDDVIKTGL